MSFACFLICCFYSFCYAVEAEHLLLLDTMEYGPVTNTDVFRLKENEGFRFSIKPVHYSRTLRIKTNIPIRMQIDSVITEADSLPAVMEDSSSSRSNSSGSTQGYESDQCPNDSITSQELSPQKRGSRLSPAGRAALMACAQKNRSYLFHTPKNPQKQKRKENLIFHPQRCSITNENFIQYNIKPESFIVFEPLISKGMEVEFGPISLR